ncbi:hypothetical protein C1646_680965, partial [Rhizophagus diaphanus]
MNPNNQSIRESKPRMTTKEFNVDSEIITSQHAELISKWIDKLEITDDIRNMYEFKLLLRGSRDGFTSKTFHEICDNQSRTVTIIKVKGSKEILGGYNPIEWKSDNSYGITSDSFIFSFKNPDNIEYILGRVKDEQHATYNHYDYGPSFGDGDLDLLGDHCSCDSLSWTYEYYIGGTIEKFLVEEYEVYQINN